MMQAFLPRLTIFGLLLVACPLVALGQPAIEAPAIRPVIRPAIAPAPATPVTEEPKKEEEAAAAPVAEPAPPKPPQFIRMTLMDGSVISGDLSIKTITVATDYGELVVPISKIISLKPGLDSYPEMAQNIRDLIENLGADDFKEREEAHKELAKMGAKILAELTKFKDAENSEQKRHIAELIKTIGASQDEADEFEDGSKPEAAWINNDRIVTTSFTIVGKVSPKTFTIESKYGPLKVSLGDVQVAERPTDVKEVVRRIVRVDGTYIIQRNVKSSGVNVKKGDSISITADGQIAMTPWGSNAFSTPIGASNYGTYKPNIYSGALLARIGKSGEELKVGNRTTFTAKQSGTLYFGIAMNASYAGNNYQFPGSYNVRVKVTPQ